MRPKHHLCCTWAVMLAAALAAPAFCAALPQDQMQELAAEFATTAGVTWGETTETVARQNVNRFRKSEQEFRFHNFATIGVDPKKGVITSAADYAAANEANATPQPAKLDEAAALARATEILRAAGLASLLELEKPNVKLHEWSTGVFVYIVTWRLLYQGLPYDTVAAQVTISAVDGRLQVLSTGLDVTPPASIEVKLTKESALGSAIGYAKQVAPTLQVTSSEAEARIVTPNSYWVRWGLGDDLGSEAVPRVAWVVTVEGEGSELIFWIDAADGRLLGGTQSGGAVAPPATTAVPAASGSIAFLMIKIAVITLSCLMVVFGFRLVRKRSAVVP